MGLPFIPRFIILTMFLVVCLADESEDVCNQVINIHGGYRTGSSGTKGCVTQKSMEELMGQMLINISSVLEDNGSKNRSCRETSKKPRDCQDIKNEGHQTTGIYTIYPGTEQKEIRVRCDMDTTTGGWTVIQRRISDSGFFKTWYDYKVGFGNLSENYWLGNENIHAISTQNLHQLRVDLTSNDDETAFAEYKIFFVGDSYSDYRLLVDWFIGGNAGDSLGYHNGQRFSTKDRDNDSNTGHCAQVRLGGWWFKNCFESMLNGDNGNRNDAIGPIWQTWKGYHVPIKMTEMKIRPWYT